MEVALKKSATGEIKQQKIGWSWTLFLFSGFFGVPLFMRGLKGFGILTIALSLVNYTQTGWFALIASLAALAWCIWLGIKGNEITGNALLQNGWEFAEPASAEARTAVQAWKTDGTARSENYKKLLQNAIHIDKAKIAVLVFVVIGSMFHVFQIVRSNAKAGERDTLNEIKSAYENCANNVYQNIAGSMTIGILAVLDFKFEPFNSQDQYIMTRISEIKSGYQIIVPFEIRLKDNAPIQYRVMAAQSLKGYLNQKLEKTCLAERRPDNQWTFSVTNDTDEDGD